MQARWRVVSSKSPRDTQEILEELLKNRGISNPEDFFEPPSPQYFLSHLKAYLPDLKEKELVGAVARLKKAIRKKEKIAVWGDYDVDGIAATAILWRVLWNLGADVLPYIPDRFTEGYGLNQQGLEKLAKQGVKLVVTVDSGITAKKEIDQVVKLGMGVIITDHHLKPKVLPKALAIVHSTALCGTGLAWVLAAHLDSFPKVEKELDLVAVATIADLQPVVGANRILLKRGFEVLNRLSRPGLLALCESAGLKSGTLGSYAAGWVLGPRINAAGRLKDGMEALRLLCTPNLTKAQELAHVLGSANSERKLITEKIMEEAREMVEPEGLIVVYEDGWHEGVIGLVAGHLVREYGRPAIVISRGAEFSKGSARSVNGLNIVEVLSRHSHHLTDLGGHAAAAGFTIETKNLEAFAKEIKEKMQKELLSLDTRPVLKADLRLPLDVMNFELVSRLMDFEPTGLGNPAPLFLSEGATVLSARTIGKDGKHLLLQLAPGLEAIWFGEGERDFKRGQKVSFIYAPEINSYRGKERLSLKVQDLKEV